jgi:hypothetical protein
MHSSKFPFQSLTKYCKFAAVYPRHTTRTANQKVSSDDPGPPAKASHTLHCTRHEVSDTGASSSAPHFNNSRPPSLVSAASKRARLPRRRVRCALPPPTRRSPPSGADVSLRAPTPLPLSLPCSVEFFFLLLF